MDDIYRESASQLHARLLRDVVTPQRFRAALLEVPRAQRDAWVDVVLGLESIHDDGDDLPLGCVPYWPSSVDALLRLVDQASIRPSDVFVDVGAGVGRAAALVHLLSGASVIGLEVQGALVIAFRDLARRLGLSRIFAVEGDAAALAGRIVIGTVFYLYCPFSGERLERVLDDLEPIARTRQLRICCLDLPLPSRSWLEPLTPLGSDLVVCRSRPLAGAAQEA